MTKPAGKISMSFNNASSEVQCTLWTLRIYPVLIDGENTEAPEADVQVT